MAAQFRAALSDRQFIREYVLIFGNFPIAAAAIGEIPRGVCGGRRRGAACNSVPERYSSLQNFFCIKA
jgi:hypothetical protein